MANIKQQKKRILVAQRQRLENLRYQSQIKTYFRRLTASVNSGDEAVVVQDTGEEPREPISGRAAGGFTEVLQPESHEILPGELTSREAPG